MTRVLHFHPNRRSLLWLILLLVLSACAPPNRDCIWSGTAIAWIDQNNNQLRDQGEPPLADVSFRVDDVLNGYERVGRSISDSKGEAPIGVWLPGCPAVKFEVYPDIPMGYRLTTVPRLPADDRDSGQVFEFGFTYLPGIPTVTPLPLPPACTSYSLPGMAESAILTDLAVSPDGAVWAATYGSGVFRYDSLHNQWISYKTEDGLVDDRVQSITASADGLLWVATDGGAACFDGVSWSAYTTSQGLAHNEVQTIVVTPDKSVWFGTRAGISYYQWATNQWITPTVANGLAVEWIVSGAAMSDGSVWFCTLSEGTYRFIPTSTGVVARRYNTDPLDDIEDIQNAADGSSWIASQSGLVHFDPAEDSWFLYDSLELGYPVPAYLEALAIAPDGSLWIATESELYRFTPARDSTMKDSWLVYDDRDSVLQTGDYIRALAVTADGILWVGAKSSVSRCLVPGGE